MFFLKKLVLKHNFFSFFKNKKSFSLNSNIIGSRKNKVLFLNDNIYATCIQVIYLVYFTLQKNQNILVLDLRSNYRELIKIVFKTIKHPNSIIPGFLTNQSIIFTCLTVSKKISLAKKPNLVIIFDAIDNLNLIKELNIFKIPTICFYNKIKLYSNLYRVINQPSFRNFFCLLYTFKCIFYYKFKFCLNKI